MADNSNNTNYPDQSDDQKSIPPQDKKLHETDENTYWEQPENQTYNQQSNSQPQESGHPDIPEPHHYQQGDIRGVNTPPKKKFQSILAVILAIVLILMVGAGIAYANKYTIINSIAKMTKSPAEYYAFVEKNNMAFIIDALASKKDDSADEDNTKYAYDVTTDVSIDHDAVDSMLKSYLGTGLTDLETLIGIPLENISAESVVGADGDLINETLGLSLNNVKLITAELFMNSATNETFLRLPELSPAYLRLTDGETFTSDVSALDEITPQRTADLMKRYSDIMIDNIDQVAFGENKLLTIDNLSKDCMSLNIIITPDDLYQIENAVLASVRTDEYIINLLPVYNITVEQYQSYLDEIQTKIENSKDTLEELTMVVYVDSQGRILSRAIFSEDSVASIGYTILFDKANVEYNVYLTDDTGSTVFDVQGNQSMDHGTSNGAITASVNTYEGDSSNISIDITYEDLRMEQKGDHTYLYGNVTMSSMEMMGMQIIMDFDAPEDSQTCKTVFQMGAASLVTINSEIKYLENFPITAPPEDAEVYDTSQIESYTATYNFDDYIANLSEQFGVDLQSMIDSYLSGITY